MLSNISKEKRPLRCKSLGSKGESQLEKGQKCKDEKNNREERHTKMLGIQNTLVKKIVFEIFANMIQQFDLIPKKEMRKSKMAI